VRGCGRCGRGAVAAAGKDRGNDKKFEYTIGLWGDLPDSLWGALAWIVGILAVFVPLSVWRYRRMS
jgi:hypothetical protein